MTDQERNFWNNTIGNAFEPLKLSNPNATDQQRIAHAAEVSAYFLQQISERLEKMERRLSEGR